MWKILGPPAIFMTKNVVANLHHKYLGPHFAGHFEKWGSANRPKMDQFENFSIIYCTKSKLKGGQFNENKSQLLYFRPHIVGRLGAINPELSNFKILEQFPI